MEAANEVQESTEARIARLCPSEDLTDYLSEANALGISDKDFIALASAVHMSRKQTIVLPFQHYETLSRGRGWCRQGRGAKAIWGERVKNGYRVGPGEWLICGNDGFRREKRVAWTVSHIHVGGNVWTIAF